MLIALWANSTAAHGTGASPTALDFELSDGQRFVRLAELPPQPTVVNFWRYDCPPCLREMPLLATHAAHGQVRVITVALHRPAETAMAPPGVRQALTSLMTLYAPSTPQGVLARFGNPHGALPHTVVLAADRSLCAQHTGEIDSAWLAHATQNCSAHGTPTSAPAARQQINP